MHIHAQKISKMPFICINSSKDCHILKIMCNFAATKSYEM